MCTHWHIDTRVQPQGSSLSFHRHGDSHQELPALGRLRVRAMANPRLAGTKYIVRSKPGRAGEGEGEGDLV